MCQGRGVLEKVVLLVVVSMLCKGQKEFKSSKKNQMEREMHTLTCMRTEKRPSVCEPHLMARRIQSIK